MKGVLAAATIAIGSLAACETAGSLTTVADLVTEFGNARKQPAEAAFHIDDISIDGVTRRSVVAGQTTRLTYHVTVPKHATFRVSLGVDPNAWSRAGHGVLFLIGVSDGRWYQTKHSITIDPFAQAGARRWHDVSVSLEEFAGLTVDMVLNTRPAGAGGSAGLVAVWGTPVVVAQ
jgi:hypothetical protein